MSEVAPKELRIVGFLCNWCSYGGADTAGVGRFRQPTDLRIIRVPCSGRVDPMFVVRALLTGADGVLVSGCHPRDCHYTDGNFYARRRLEMLKRLLPFLGRYRYPGGAAPCRACAAAFRRASQSRRPDPGC